MRGDEKQGPARVTKSLHRLQAVAASLYQPRDFLDRAVERPASSAAPFPISAAFSRASLASRPRRRQCPPCAGFRAFAAGTSAKGSTPAGRRAHPTGCSREGPARQGTGGGVSRRGRRRRGGPKQGFLLESRDHLRLWANPMKSNYLFTSESVSEGHPDKVADQVSDAVLDAILAQDPRSRVAAETLCNTGLVVLAGEITTHASVDYIQVARDTIKRIGYDNTDFGIDYRGCAVMVCYDKQSPDIAAGRGPRLRRVPEPGRGRPGNDVRLRVRRDCRLLMPAADPLLAPPGRAPVAGKEGRPAAVASAGREEPGDDALRGRQAGRRRNRGAVHAARARGLARTAQGSGDRDDHQARAAQGDDQEHATTS